MADKNSNICRLCLRVDATDYCPLDEACKLKLKLVVPEANINVPSDFITCGQCSYQLQEFHKLKHTVSQTEALIKSQRNNLQIVDKVSLNGIIKSASPDENICRLCLKAKQEGYASVSDFTNHLNDALKLCFPNLDTLLTLDPVVCGACKKILLGARSFKMECMSVEQKIKSYSQSKSIEDANVDLHKVLGFSLVGDECDFLDGFEVQDEDGMAIFESVLVNNKKQGVDKRFVEEDDLPSFTFDNNLIHNALYSQKSLPEWLANVDEVKSKRNWSDAMTIHKVLTKLKGQKEVHTWFSNISDVLNWDEWKTKLQNAVPTRNDYYFALKSMYHRTKRQNETYVRYYNVKVQLLEKLGITGEAAVSCILGGVNNVLTSCMGRMGLFKTPEQLLPFLQTCDEKEALQISDKKALTCSMCKKIGHTAEVCRSLNKNVKNQSKPVDVSKPAVDKPSEVVEKPSETNVASKTALKKKRKRPARRRVGPPRQAKSGVSKDDIAATVNHSSTSVASQLVPSGTSVANQATLRRKRKRQKKKSAAAVELGASNNNGASQVAKRPKPQLQTVGRLQGQSSYSYPYTSSYTATGRWTLGEK